MQRRSRSKSSFDGLCSEWVDTGILQFDNNGDVQGIHQPVWWMLTLEWRDEDEDEGGRWGCFGWASICIAVIKGRGVQDIIEIVLEYSFLHRYTNHRTNTWARPLQHLISIKHRNILNSLDLV